MEESLPTSKGLLLGLGAEQHPIDTLCHIIGSAEQKSTCRLLSRLLSPKTPVRALRNISGDSVNVHTRVLSVG